MMRSLFLCFFSVHGDEQFEFDLSGAPTGARGLQVHVRRQVGDSVVRPQLLLPVR